MGYAVFSSHISPKMLLAYILGSEGTLGIITEVTLQLETRSEVVQGLALSLDSLDKLFPLIEIITSSAPYVCSGFDAKTLSLCTTISKTIATRHSNDVFTLYIKYSGAKEVVERNISRLCKTLPLSIKGVYVCTEEELKEYDAILFTQRASLEKYSGGLMRCVSICNDLVFPVESYVLALKEIQSLCEEYGILYSTTAHPCSGVIRVETLFDLHSKATPELITVIISQTAHIVKWYRGAITYSYGDGITNTPTLPTILGASLARTLQKIKNVWDPENIFNPGKKTTLSLTYVKESVPVLRVE